MLTLSGISKAYGGRVLFADVTLQVNRQDRLRAGLARKGWLAKADVINMLPLGKLKTELKRKRGATN